MKLFLLFTLFIPIVALPQAAPQPNSDPAYQQLRRVTLSGEAVSVSDLVLKRDAGIFTFKSGTFYFVAPVDGKVTGAVFVGDGQLSLTPPLPEEQVSLSRLTRGNEFVEHFDTAVLRFTDGSAAEIKAAGKAASGGGNPAGALNDSEEVCRRKLHYNLDARILQDVLSPTPGGLFVAFIHGKNYNSKLLYTVDPHGAGFVAPEEISLRTYDENNLGIWAAFHYTDEYKNGRPRGTERNDVLDVQHEGINAHIERSGMLHGKVETTFVARYDGVRVVPFDLFGPLRVSSVTDESGQALSFIQEDKNDDPDFWVILPKPLAKGEKFIIKTAYDGKDAVRGEGSGNYDLVARDDWYPAGAFGDYADYDMTLGVPKPMTMVATGAPVKKYTEGNENISIWKSEAPEAVAGFNFGLFKSESATVAQYGYTVESYANTELPDWMASIQRATAPLPTVTGAMPVAESAPVTLGAVSTVALIKKPLAEADLALQLYSDYFGPLPYKRLAMTQQSPCNFGQSWPELVYLPICSFFDDTIKHQLLGTIDMRGYWRVVGPHEVAHQWWEHTVGWGSYRDQWMSEGFADFSASLFIQSVWKNPRELQKFWKDERDLITDRTRFGFRPNDVGPVTMGYRLANSRVGSEIPRRLIYTKGAYILHMIRMLMWDRQTGDANFKAMMRDFVQTYTEKPASTEDFKAMVEKHMTRAMDLDGNGRMDWFFNEYVYGTELPTYSIDYSFTPAPEGFLMKLKITQSGVSDKFVMPVPIYLELADGRVIQIGSARMHGDTRLEQEVPIRGLKEAPKRAMLNYYYDVLSTD